MLAPGVRHGPDILDMLLAAALLSPRPHTSRLKTPYIASNALSKSTS